MDSFCFREFSLQQDCCAMKVGTDGVLLGAWVSTPARADARILDVGTGSGLIALMLAQRCPQAVITGIDIDGPSAGQTAANFASSPWGSRLKALHSDFLSFEDAEGFDLIVSNPPFFSGTLQSPQARRRTARHSDTLPHREMIAAAKRLLRPAGVLAVVLPVEEGAGYRMEAFSAGLPLRRICRVSTIEGQEPRRVLMEFSASGGRLTEEYLSIEGPGGRSEAYRRLTQVFYL